MEQIAALERFQEQLGMVRGRRAQRTVERWGLQCAAIARAGLGLPGDLPDWVAGLERDEAEEIVRALVVMAQDGDELALAAVLVCLRFGLCAVAGREGVSVDEVMAEAALRVVDFPVHRRQRVAGGIVLDVRNRLYRQRKKLSHEVSSGDMRAGFEDVAAPGELGVAITAPERLAGLVADAHHDGRITEAEARLILQTRVLGERVAVESARQGITRNAAYLRRWKAEKRLAA